MSDAAVPPASVASLLREIDSIGTDPQRGGYSRPVFSTAETDLRGWFTAHAAVRGLDLETDRNGIIWAWWNPSGAPLADAVTTGSHLDSVPGGGQFDGPLGVASALVAVDLLVARGVTPTRALAIMVFPEEEGSRFGIACLGSRLMTGDLDPDRARNLRDSDGNRLSDVARTAGLEPQHMGRDDQALQRIGTFLELHVEQGRGLIDLGQPVAIGSSILGHGRWKLVFSGQGNHAGTTLMTDRADPMIAVARVTVAIRDLARRTTGARATVGRVQPVPGGTNVIASRVDMWLDVRHPDDAVVISLVQAIIHRAGILAAEEGCRVELIEESYSSTVHFDLPLRNRLAAALPGAPILDTGAGHDAGVLSSHLPTAMLFVRNPTGVSHSPEEHVENHDAEVGAQVLADALAGLVQPSTVPAESDHQHTDL